MANSVQQGQFVSASLYVGDLAPEVTENMLYEVFHSVGPVASIRVCRDSVTRKSLGYAYVNYHSVSDAERALDTLNYSTIKNQPCRIMWSHRDPSLRKNNIGNVFVKNLDKTIDNKALYDTFSLFGNILSCKVDESGKNLGFGFIHFESAESAKSAIERVNGMQIGSKTVYVGHFIRKSERISQSEKFFTNVYVKHIPKSWTEDKLKELFQKCGEVTSIALKTDNKGRPFGFVNFATPEGARQAIEMYKSQKPTDDGVMHPEPVGEGEEANPSDVLYVGRAMSKGERAQFLKCRMSNSASSNDDGRGSKFKGINLYLKNLDESIDDNKLFDAFSPFGTVLSAKVMRDQQGQSRGFGFVCFESPDAATTAVTEMHLKLMNGKPLYVGLAEKREVRLQKLQQRYRLPNVRPGPGGMGGGAAGPMHYNPQMIYSQAQPVPVHQHPRMMGYTQNMMAWRPPGARAYTPLQGAVPQVPAYPQQLNQQQRGARYARNQQQHQGPRADQGHIQQQPFKFTHEARNREAVAAQIGGMPAEGNWMGGSGGQVAGEANPLPTEAGLSAQGLYGASPQVQKQVIGERLYPRIHEIRPDLAGKITGMMLEMDSSELLMLLESESQLKAKVDEAVGVLQQARETS